MGIENKNEQKEKIYLNSETNTLSSSIVNNIQVNNIKDNKDNSNRVIKTQILSPYKSGLLSKTTLKSIDKYSLKSLLDRFNEKSNNSRDKNDSKSKIKSNKDNIQLNNINTKNKKITIQNDTKTKNKIRLKKRYLILRDNRNGNIVKSIKKNNPLKLNDKNDINLRNELFKTAESFNSNKLKINSFSTKNNNRHNKINF